MIQRVVKTAAAAALHRTGVDRLIERLDGGAGLPVVIGYHRVVDRIDADDDPGLLVTASTLERHVDWIGRRFDFASLDEVGAALESGRRSSRPLAAITFDDGYRDVAEHALPLLRRKGVPAAVFVVTDFADAGGALRHDRLRRALRAAARAAGTGLPEGLDRALLDLLPARAVDRVVAALEEELSAGAPPAPCLTWEALAATRDAGFTIGSHTRSHPWLTEESAADVAQEVAGSRHAIRRRLGVEVAHFAYPDGRFSPDVVRAVALAGYSFGYTICDHRDVDRPLLTIPRVMLCEGATVDAGGRFSPSILACHVRGVLRRARPCRRPHGLPAQTQTQGQPQATSSLVGPVPSP